MTIPRFHLFELEDFSWFPNIIRDLATDYLQFMETKMALHRPVVPVLADALRTSGVSQLRAYTPDELLELAASQGDVEYEWSAGKVSVSGSGPPNLTYLVGLPGRCD